MRQCKKCGEGKTKNDFHGRTEFGGVQNQWCKDCILERDIERVSPHKTCSSCDVRKMRDEFNRDVQAKDGLAYSCRECVERKKQLAKKKTIAVAPSKPLPELSQAIYDYLLQRPSRRLTGVTDRDRERLRDLKRIAKQGERSVHPQL